MLLIVLLCVTVVGLALCQTIRVTKRPDKSAKRKYEPDYTDKKEEYSDEYYDRNSAVTTYYESQAFRNNRAIDNTRYVKEDSCIMKFHTFLLILYKEKEKDYLI